MTTDTNAKGYFFGSAAETLFSQDVGRPTLAERTAGQAQPKNKQKAAVPQHLDSKGGLTLSQPPRDRIPLRPFRRACLLTLPNNTLKQRALPAPPDTQPSSFGTTTTTTTTTPRMIGTNSAAVRLAFGVSAVVVALRTLGTGYEQLQNQHSYMMPETGMIPYYLVPSTKNTTTLRSPRHEAEQTVGKLEDSAASSLSHAESIKTSEVTARVVPPSKPTEGVPPPRSTDEAASATTVESEHQMIDSTPPPSPPPPQPPRTLAFSQGKFSSGFRNEGMVFTWFVMYAAQNNYSQILMDSVNWKDLYGKVMHGDHAPHKLLFDVEHWNSFHPRLPLLVEYNATEHYEFDNLRKAFLVQNSVVTASHPYAYGTYRQCMNQYKMYTKRLQGNPRLPRDAAEVLMMRGAFRPSPELQSIINHLHDGGTYLALHARIEPDMQAHRVCRDHKVIRLTDILDSLQRQFPQPTFQKVFIATNRPMLEQVVSDPSKNNTVAEENLDELNRIIREGLWNGTVSVFEAGTAYMLRSNTTFEKFSGIAGAVTDYFLALQAQIFVGTEVSSFSTDLIQSRFFKDNRHNYFYRPDGLHLATPPDALQPPRFYC